MQHLIRSYVRLLLEMQTGGIGVEQSIGIGKNYHTVNPEPFTWENYSGLQFELDADPSGVFYAAVKVLDYPEWNTPLRKFNDEQSAMFWIRNFYEQMHQKLMALESTEDNN